MCAWESFHHVISSNWIICSDTVDCSHICDESHPSTSPNFKNIDESLSECIELVFGGCRMLHPWNAQLEHSWH